MRGAREHHLQHRAETRAGGIAIAGLFDEPLAVAHRSEQIGDRLVAFLGDEEFDIAQARGTETGEEPAASDPEANPVLAAIETEPDAVHRPPADLRDRR